MENHKPYIDGIYNYCDRWCERCAFTRQCRSFAMGQEIEQAQHEGRDPDDIDWDAFWKRVGLAFDRTPPDWLAEFGEAEDGLEIDFEESGEADWQGGDALAERTHDHPLVVRAFEYASLTRNWLRQHSAEWADEPPAHAPHPATATGADKPIGSDDLRLQDAVAIISWYHTLIPVKLARAVEGLLEAGDDAEPWRDSLEISEDEDDIDAMMRESAAHDAAGSGKAALISIERSIGAWTAIRSTHTNLAESIQPIQRLLGWIRVSIDRQLPEARTFQRPGFDD